MKDPVCISEKIVSFYSFLYKESFCWRSLLDDLAFDSISRKNVEGLERPFDEDEVTGVVRSLNGDKAPGPNGFSLAFFQFCWKVVKEDILSMFDEFA